MKKTFTSLRFFPYFLSVFFLVLQFESHALTRTVINNLDSGGGSLRDAVTLATAGDVIEFIVPMTITLSSTLTISKSITIDATTVGVGWSAANNQITIVGNGSVANGLQLSASGITIKGITFQNFATNCIYISGAPNFSIKSCFFNTNSTASAISTPTSQGVGIYIYNGTSYGIIGGSNPADANVFYTATTNRTCVDIYNVSGTSATNRIVVQGNKFGTNYAGTVNFGLASNCGIKCSYTNYVDIGGLLAGQGNQFEGSVSANASAIWLDGTSGTSNVNIQGNKIGVVGTNSNYNGILFNSSPNSNIVVEKNTINNCQNYGIVMPGSSANYTQVKITQNSFSSNVGGAISSSMYPSNINAATPYKVIGNAYAATANATVEIYSWDGIGSTSAQGTTFIASVTADATGAWYYYGSFTVGQKLVITTTPSTGSPSTTTFSPSFTVTTCPSSVFVGSNQTICATTPTVNLSGGGSYISSPYNWSVVSGGGGTLTNSTTLSPTYNLSATEQNNTTAPIVVTIRLTVATSTCQPTISNQMTITINPKPTSNAGSDINTCTNLVGGVTLNGSVTTATGGTWTGGSGTYAPDANTLNAVYTPTTSEKSAGSVNLTLTSTGNGTCTAASDVMIININPPPTVNAGSDQTMCAATSNIIVTGTVTGTSSVHWTSSGSGTFTNANNLSAIYTPSSSDKTAGSVNLTLSTTGSCPAVSDVAVLTINPCLIDPQLMFQSPTVFINSGSNPFKQNFAPLNSAGAITYSIQKMSTLGTTSCASIDANGFVTPTCVDTVLVTAYQARKVPYEADTASYTMYISRAVTHIELESRGAAIGGAPFRLMVKTNYDQALTYTIVGGDASVVNVTSDGLITPLTTGTAYIRASAAGDYNFQSANSNDAIVTIYPKLTNPVALNDTIRMSIGEEKTVDIGQNDYGTTASIQLSPSMLFDIDAENPGVQNKYFKPGIGIFTVDEVGVLTFTAFEAFIGIDSIQYTVTDADGLVSKPASVVIYVTSPVNEIALKANEIMTPNNDKLNDALVIGYTDLTQDNDLLVVDAAGNKLYYEQNYQNDWYATDQGGNILGNGVYYFIFREFNSSGSVRRELKGNFTVIR